MEPIFRQEYTLSAIDVDCFGRLKPAGILYLAQESAGAHCKALSVDWDTLAGRRLFWAVLRHRAQITRLPTLGETITVETWPTPTTRSAYPRSTLAFDSQGKELFRCISLWVLMDMDKRTMVLPGKSGILVEGTLRGNELMAPSSLVPKPLACQTQCHVAFTQLDRNGHMNNTRYLDWLTDLLPSQFHQTHPLKEFTLCYLAEAKEGDTVHLNWQLSDGPCLEAEGDRLDPENREKQTRIFSAKLLF